MDISENFRNLCETRWLAAQPELDQVKYCELIQKHRGREAAVALYRAAQSLLATPASTPSADGQTGLF